MVVERCKRKKCTSGNPAVLHGYCCGTCEFLDKAGE